jgi:hypothetical protein
MAQPRLVDAVTLRHFGVVNRMEVLGARLVDCPQPRWTDAVRDEILEHMDEDDCSAVLAADFLGSPYRIPMNKLSEVFRIRKGISDEDGDSARHLGEAETIWVADHVNGTVLTDDFDAYHTAEKLLGSNRVMDTVAILSEAVKADEIDTNEAKQIFDGIRNSGRHIRPGHPPTVTADYFSGRFDRS